MGRALPHDEADTADALAMMTVVRKLPRGVKLSARLREHAPYYLMITSFGIPYYIPATPKIRLLLELDENGKDAPRDRRKRYDRYTKADALRDIVQSLELHTRDVVLTGIEEHVTSELVKQMADAMRAKVHRATMAKVVERLALPDKSCETSPA